MSIKSSLTTALDFNACAQESLDLHSISIYFFENTINQMVKLTQC